MHSQKGIVRIVPQEHLSVIMIKDRNTLIADLAMGSIISRQTNGQIYKSVHGLRGVRDKTRLAIDKIKRHL